MERLVYTTRETTDNSKNNSRNNPKGRIDQLKGNFSGKIDLFAIMRYAKDAAIGFVMGIGSFLVLLSAFGLSWSHYDWPDGSFGGGMIRTWNIAARHLAATDGVFPPQLAGADGDNGFFLAMVLLFLIGVGAVISLSRNNWFILFYALLVGLPSVIWGMHPSVPAVTVLAAGVMLHVVNSAVPDLLQGYRGFLYAAMIAALSFVLMCVPAIGSLADRPQALDDSRENVQLKAADAYYGTNPLHDGDLTAKTKGSQSGTALEVTMSSPDALYLRGFVGDVLEHDGWEPLSSATYYKNKDLFYWLGENGFNGLGQIGQAASLADQGGKKKLNDNYFEQTNSVSVKNIDADKRYAYIPYEISTDGVEGAKNWGDSFLTGGKLKKMESYSFSASPNKVSKWTDIAAKFYTNKVTVPEQKAYLDNESHYNEYVYKKFTYISREDRHILTTVLGDKGDQKRGHVEYNTAVKHVKQLISTNLEYTDSLKGYKENNSALENIFSRRNGYDAQIATAAVMMFRYYGIPSRYVEGYLITQEDAASGTGVIEVPRKNAHAWPEIYVDGIGFVPVEVCSAYTGMMQEADYNVGITTKSRKALTDKSKENSTNPNVREHNGKINAGGKKIPERMLLILGILAGLCLLALIIFLGRKLIRGGKTIIDRKKLFRKGEPREAVRAMYKHMDDKKIEPDREAAEIGNRASYSILSVTETDRTAMLKKLKTLKGQKRKGVKSKTKIKTKTDKTEKGNGKKDSGQEEPKQKKVKWGNIKKKSKKQPGQIWRRS